MNTIKYIKIFALCGIFALSTWTTASMAHAEHFTKTTRSAQKSYDFRISTMTVYKWYLSPMGAMAKGKIDFDAKVFSHHAKGLAIISTLDLLEGFPKGSDENQVEDSSANTKIWENWQDFEKKYQNFQVETKKLAEVATSGDEESMKAQFKKTADSCNSCHKQYKTKN